MTDETYLIYDGECPFCSRYVRYSRFREAVGSVRLIDARSDAPEVRAARERGFDLDDGMLLRLDGRDYHGADCLNRVALMSSDSGLFNRVNRALFRWPAVSAVAYPLLRAGRNATLRLLGRSRLDP